MARLTSGNFQTAGKKMEGQTQQANFGKPAKIAPVKATESLPPSMANPKPFVRPAMPGMRVQKVAGINRGYPTKVNVPAGHTAQAHKVNSGQ